LTKYSRSRTVVPQCCCMVSTLYSTIAVERSGGGGGCSRLLSTLDCLSLATLKTRCKRQRVGISNTIAFSPAFFSSLNGPVYGCWNFRELLLSFAAPVTLAYPMGSDRVSRNTWSPTRNGCAYRFSLASMVIVTWVSSILSRSILRVSDNFSA